jgi:hypothetical protein
MIKSFATAMAAACLFAGVSCTTNVENPTVNQQGRGGNSCITSCDSDQVTCVAKCTDDRCKASCEATHTMCVSSCPAPDAG